MHHTRVIIALVAIATCAFFAGCASSGNEMDMARVSEIQKGVTTRSDLIARFGSPYSVGFDTEGNATAQWFYVEARNRAGNFIPIVGAFNMKIDQRTQQLLVIFNPDDTVKTFTFNDGTSTLKSGIIN